MEKLYDFFTATAIPPISRTYIICERVVKRLWNVLNAPAPPQPLYLLGFRQIRERWNLFFENLFFLEKHTEGLRGKDPLSPSVCLYSYHAPSHWKCSRRGLHTDSCRYGDGDDPIIINSGYRSAQVNKAVGGVATSNHLTGCAVDIRVLGMEQLLRYAVILLDISDESQEDFDELLIERNAKGTYWLHFAVRPEGNRRKIRLIAC